MHKSTQFGLGAVAAILIVPSAMWADVQGITGSSTDGPEFGRDDYNVATTKPISFFKFCSWLQMGLQNRFPSFKFTFAGNGSSIGNLFQPIVDSDFNISNYEPWVVDNYNPTGPPNPDPGEHFIASPDGTNQDRGVKGQDAGGANIVVNYTPRACAMGGTVGVNCDPTRVNFVQSYVQNFNDTNPNFQSGNGTTDSQPRTPYYNSTGFDMMGNPTGIHGNSGSGNMQTNGLTSLTATAPTAGNPNGTPAWLLDIPYDYESFLTNRNCDPRGFNNGDEGLCKSTVLFQSFIESNQTLYYNPNAPNGQNAYSLTQWAPGDCPMGYGNGPGQCQTQSWAVLYGGVQWGYDYANFDTPEPSTFVPLTAAAVGFLVCLYRRRYSRPLVKE